MEEKQPLIQRAEELKSIVSNGRKFPAIDLI